MHTVIPSISIRVQYDSPIIKKAFEHFCMNRLADVTYAFPLCSGRLLAERFILKYGLQTIRK